MTRSWPAAALSLRFKAAMELADVSEAERCAARNEALVSELGQPALTWAALHHQATLRILRAEPDAEAAMNVAYELGMAAIGPPDMAFLSGGHRFNLFWDTDRLGEMGELVELAARSGYPTVKAFLAFLLYETGRTDEAAAIFDDLVAADVSPPTHNVGWLMYLACCAWMCSRLGRVDCVPGLRAQLEPFPELFSVASFGGWILGPTAFFLGPLCTIAGDWTEADAYFAEAAGIHEASTRPPGWHAPGSNGPGCSWPVATGRHGASQNPPAPGARDSP